MRLPFLAYALLGAALLAPASASADAVYHRGIAAAPKTLDPHRATSAVETAVLLDLYEGLVTRNAAGDPVPGVASEWTVSPDGLTVTFKLRPSAWSNGEPVTAEDFVLSFRRLMEKSTASPVAERLVVIRNAARVRAGRAAPEDLGARAIDDQTLEIRLEAPNAALPELLADTAALPLYLKRPAPTPKPDETAATATTTATPTPVEAPTTAEEKPAADAAPAPTNDATAAAGSETTTATDQPAEAASTAATEEKPAAATPPPPPVVAEEKKGPELYGPVVNGPYRLTEESPTRLTMVKNEAFREAGSVAIGEVVYEVVANPETARERFEKGELHSTDQAPVYNLAKEKTRLGDALHLAPFAGALYIALDTARRPLSDARIRRGLAMAIDRDKLANAVWGGAMRPALSFLPPGMLADAEPAAIDIGGETVEARRAAAKALLVAANFPPDTRTRIELRVPKSDLNRRTAQAIIADWAAVGVPAVMVEAEAAAHYRSLAGNRPFSAAMAVWIADHSDASNFLEVLRGDNAAMNLSHFANAEYDTALKQAASATDPAARATLLQKADAILAREVPVIPLLHYLSLSLVSAKLKGWTDNPLNVHPTRYLSLQ